MDNNGILMLGASHSDYHAFRILQESGYKVFTTGNYDKGLLATMSANHYPCDYSDFRSCLELVEFLKPIGILPSANDFSYMSSILLSDHIETINCDTHENALLIHEKDRFRLLCRELNLPSPALYLFVANGSKILFEKPKFPCIVKPINLTGGKGITVAGNHHELDNAIDYAMHFANSPKCIVEEYIDGTLHSLSAFINNGVITEYHIDSELISKSFGVISSISPVTSHEFYRIKAMVAPLQKVVDNLALVDGLLHTQILLGPEKDIIIEITRRTPGDLYSFPVEMLSNITYSYNIVRSWLPTLELQDIPLDRIYPNFQKPAIAPTVCHRHQAYTADHAKTLNGQYHHSEFSVYSFTQNLRGLKPGQDIDPKGVFFAWR